MCTASWIRGDEELLVLFNRDERHERLPALPPALGRARGVSWIGPRDADAGGTWIAVSERGLVLCLLNGEDRREPRSVAGRAWESRGSVIPAAVDARSPREALARVREELALESLRAFRLLALAPGEATRGLRWDGRELVDEGPLRDDEPVVSSSLDERRASELRRAVWRELVGAAPDPARLERFHASHEPERGAFSPCMHRADARTVSRTRVRVDARAVSLEYHGGAPCETGSAVAVELARARAARV